MNNPRAKQHERDSLGYRPAPKPVRRDPLMLAMWLIFLLSTACLIGALFMGFRHG